MKPIRLIVLPVLVMLVASCSPVEKPVSLADLHPTKPSHATYDPTNDWTTIEMDGGTVRMKGNNTNGTFYLGNGPRPTSPKRFEMFYQLGNPQTAVAAEYLGQKDGYAYLRLRSFPVDHPKKVSTQIVYVPLTNLDQTFRETLPEKGRAQ